MVYSFAGSCVLHFFVFVVLSPSKSFDPSGFKREGALVAVLQPGVAIVPNDQNIAVSQEPKLVANEERLVEPVVDVARPAPAPSNSERSEVANSPSMDSEYYPVEKLTKRPRILREPNFDLTGIGTGRASGKLRLQLWISQSGSVVRVNPGANRLSEELVGMAVRAFENVAYTPGEVRGLPVATLIWVEVDFDDPALLTPGQ